MAADGLAFGLICSELAWYQLRRTADCLKISRGARSYGPAHSFLSLLGLSRGGTPLLRPHYTRNLPPRTLVMNVNFHPGVLSDSVPLHLEVSCLSCNYDRRLEGRCKLRRVFGLSAASWRKERQTYIDRVVTLCRLCHTGPIKTVGWFTSRM